MGDARVTEIFRYPVKGMRPEPLSAAALRKGAAVEGDRAFALQFLDDAVPADLKAVAAEAAPWMQKAHLAMQHDWPELARIIARWSEHKRTLHFEVDSLAIEEAVIDAGGRKRLAEFIRAYLNTTSPYAKSKRKVPSEMRLLGNAALTGTYADSSNGFVSLGLLESNADLERIFQTSIDRRRFRLNFYLQGAAAWSELDWVGREIRLGSCRLRVVKAIGRCPNIDVDPDSGKRCIEIFPRLKKTLGHSFVGVRATVLQGGTVRAGEAWELI